jgi:hypothetical protein
VFASCCECSRCPAAESRVLAAACALKGAAGMAWGHAWSMCVRGAVPASMADVRVSSSRHMAGKETFVCVLVSSTDRDGCAPPQRGSGCMCLFHAAICWQCAVHLVTTLAVDTGS